MGVVAGLHLSCCFFPQNTLTADDHSPEDSFTLNPEDRREYPDLQAAHRPFPKQRFRQENGHTSLQRDGPRSFLLDLPNFPDLSKADINGQNPNIQVQIFVSMWCFMKLHKIILLSQVTFQPGFNVVQSVLCLSTQERLYVPSVWTPRFQFFFSSEFLFGYCWLHNVDINIDLFMILKPSLFLHFGTYYLWY